MNTRITFFFVGVLLYPSFALGATCSQMNLTRCLDSVCAINVSSNPAARCQYCGTSSAGTPPTTGGMRSLSLGQSARYTLTEDELADAPTDPGQRYIWAARQCISKVDGCTADDVSDVYDKLIEQSCRAAGVSAQYAASLARNAQTTSATSCSTDIRACMVNANRCGPDWAACETDSDFNKFFSECGVVSAGCDEYLADIRADLTSDRDFAIENANTLLNNIVTAYQNAREQRLASAQNGCKDANAKNICIETVCAQNMPNHCGDGYESERTAATQLCEFYDTACELLD